MGLTSLFGINPNISVTLPQTSEADDSNTSALLLLGLLPAPLRLLLLFLIESTDCTALTVQPPTRPDGGEDGGDADEESEPICRIGDRQQSYSGPTGTEGVGICRPRIEECLDGTGFVVTQDEVLPRDEVVNNHTDENCDGFDDECYIGERRETYDGAPETRGIGACQPQIEECRLDGTWRHFEITQEMVLPSEEICDGLDNDCRGETPIEELNVNFDLAVEESFGDVCLSAGDGGYVAVGHTRATSWGEIDGLLVKIAGDGSVLWHRTYGREDSNDYLTSVRPLGDGYVLAGSAETDTSVSAWLVGVDANGGLQWERHFSDAELTRFYAMQVLDDGGLILAGQIVTGEEDSNGWLVKTDSSGNEQWTRIFGGTDFDVFYSIQSTYDGGVVLAGSTLWDAWLVRTDSTGIELWERTYGGEDADAFFSVNRMGERDFILGGSSNSFDLHGAWLVRVNEFGVEQWSRNLGGGFFSAFYSVQSDIEERLFVAGAIDVDPFYSDGWLIRMDGEGNEEWTGYYGTADTYEGFASMLVDRQSVVLVGTIGVMDNSTAWLVRVCVE